ncbi:MAG: glucose-6-phosphate isomerase [Clostridia bacterium]
MERYDSVEWRTSMRISIDFNNMMAERIGQNGISMQDIESWKDRANTAARRMREKRATMKWRELPHNQQNITLQLLETADYVRDNFDNFVVLGIGGSALGPIAVHRALSHLLYNELPAQKRNGPKLYVEDNIDPERMTALFDVIDVRRTAFNVITKSGSTSETMAQLLLVIDILSKKLGQGWRNNVIATTDENNGNLIGVARSNGLRTFYVPDGVGGRFSELCPVGLLAAAVCGIDINELLAGAAYMDELCRIDDTQKNPAYMMAMMHVIAMEKGCNISVIMPYADSLKYIADWYAQLWAESLGKSADNDGNIVHCGQTPVKSLGVTDQHSQVQLYTEGPLDKIITFLGVNSYRSTLTIPHTLDDIPDVAFLSGHTFNELIKCEQAATEYAVQKSGHMNNTITLPEINPFTIGELLYMFEVETAFAGELLNINAFDQPGVEEGKKATYALLGKSGYDQKRVELAAIPAKDPRFML